MDASQSVSQAAAILKYAGTLGTHGTDFIGCRRG